MLRVKKDDENQKLFISFTCRIYNNVDREISLVRPYDETLEKTFIKLSKRYTKHLNALIRDERSLLEKLKVKEKPKLNEKLNQKISNLTSKLNQLDNLYFQKELMLLDFHSNIIALETKNINAWQEGFILKTRTQDFKVCINLPSIKKVQLPRISIAGFPSVVRLEFEPNEQNKDLITNNSYFKWFTSEIISHAQAKELKRSKNKRSYPFLISEINWYLIDEGVSKRKLDLSESSANRLLKIECFPKDTDREGFRLETISDDIVMEKLDLEKMPMTNRHKYTQTFLDSN